MAVLFDPFPKQKQFLDEVFSFKRRYLLYGGGAGGGKSFASLGCMLTLLVVFPGSKGICIRDTIPNLKLTSIESWKKLIRDSIGPNSFVTSYNATEQIFYCANGSQLQFIAEDYQNKKDLGHFKGLEFNFAVLEEASELQEQTFHKTIERCGRWLPPNGIIPPPVIMLTCNPCDNWVRRVFYDPAIAGTLPPEYFFLPALIDDNKYMMANTAYIESSKQMPSYLFRKFILGDWDVTEPSEGRIYRCFDADTHITSIVYNPDLPIHGSFDENVNPFMSLVLFQVVIDRDEKGNAVKKSIYVIDEILGRHPNNTIEALCTLFTKKYPAHSAGLLIYGDATSRKADSKIESGHNLYTLIEGHLRKYKPIIRVLKSNPSVIMRTSFFDAILEKHFSNIHFHVDTHCNNTINDFLSTQADSDGTKLKNLVRDPKTKVSYQAHGHLTDCCDYFLCSAFANEFEEYKRGGRAYTPPKIGKNPPSKNSYDAPPSSRTTPRRISKNSYR